jgi:PAS domain S-box-containing protein
MKRAPRLRRDRGVEDVDRSPSVKRPLASLSEPAGESPPSERAVGRSMAEPAPFETDYAAKSKAQLVLELEALKRQLRQLEDSEPEREHSDDLLRLQALILEEMSDAVVITDIDGEIVDWTPPAERMFGYSKREALGQTTRLLLRPEAHEHFVKKMTAGLRHGRRWTGDIDFLRKDGSEGISQTVAIPFMDDDGDHMATVIVCNDVTKRRLGAAALREVHGTLETWIQQRTAQLRQTNRKLKQEIGERKNAEQAFIAAKQEAELANRTKSEFLANMSHELRTPLNAIIGFAEILTNEVFGPVGNPKYRDYAGDINTSGRHLLDLINDILDLSKVESGNMELNETDLDVAGVIRTCVTLMAERARVGGVDLLVAAQENENLLLRADKRMVKQILVNLLSNAIKFTPSGGQVTLGVRSEGESGYVMQIVDSGIGIPPDQIPVALSRFGQIDSKLARRYEGSGLGLPLAKSLVELHGGVLELKSEVDVGTTVTVTFPADRLVEMSSEVTAPEANQWVAS